MDFVFQEKGVCEEKELRDEAETSKHHREWKHVSVRILILYFLIWKFLVICLIPAEGEMFSEFC